jgi:peroxiredoxin
VVLSSVSMRRVNAFTGVVAGTVWLLAIAGCGSEDSGSPAASDSPSALSTTSPAAPTSTPASTPATPPATPPATAATNKPPAAVPAALKFTSTTVEGKPFDGATLAGKPTVLWFWAPWCPKCRAQASETAKVAAEYQGRVNVVGVAGLDKTSAMRDFVADHKLSGFPQLSDESGTVWKRFEVVEQSTYVLLDATGKTVDRGRFPGGDGLSDKVATLAD